MTTRFFRDTRGLDAVFVPFGAKPIGTDSSTQPTDVLFVGSGDLRRIFLLEGIRDHVSVRATAGSATSADLGAAARTHRRPAGLGRGTAPSARAGEDRAQHHAHRLLWRRDRHQPAHLRGAGRGCFLLTDHCDELGELFRIGEEIETYRSSGELTDKVRHYLAHPDERRAVATAGHAAFHARPSHLAGPADTSTAPCTGAPIVMTIPIHAPRWLTPVTAAFAGSLLLSLVARLGSTINRDGMLYIHTAQAFLDGVSLPQRKSSHGPSCRSASRSFPKLTGLGLENAGYLLNALFMAGACALMVVSAPRAAHPRWPGGHA